MSTQRSPKLPTGVSLYDAGTDSHGHCRVPTRFLHAVSLDVRISPPADFTPHRDGRRIDLADRSAPQHLPVQIPIAPRYR
jgi:hypothetical protein